MPESKGQELVENHICEEQGPVFKLRTGLISIGVALILLLLIVTNVINKGTLYYLDYEIYGFIKGMIRPAETAFVNNIIDYFDILIVCGCSGVFLIYLSLKKDWWNLLALFLSVGGGGILILFLKMFFGGWRPMIQIIAGRGYAFPSGHAFYAMVCFGFMIYLARQFIKNKWWQSLIYFLCILLILLIGMSLIFLKDHWFTEVLGGYCVGFHGSWAVSC